MRVYKIRPIDEPPWLILPSNARDGVMAELESANVGDTFEVAIDEMSQEEIDNLPEFDGW